MADQADIRAGGAYVELILREQVEGGLKAAEQKVQLSAARLQANFDKLGRQNLRVGRADWLADLDAAAKSSAGGLARVEEGVKQVNAPLKITRMHLSALKAIGREATFMGGSMLGGPVGMAVMQSTSLIRILKAFGPAAVGIVGLTAGVAGLGYAFKAVEDAAVSARKQIRELGDLTIGTPKELAGRHAKPEQVKTAREALQDFSEKNTETLERWDKLAEKAKATHEGGWSDIAGAANLILGLSEGDILNWMFTQIDQGEMPSMSNLPPELRKKYPEFSNVGDRGKRLRLTLDKAQAEADAEAAETLRRQRQQEAAGTGPVPFSKQSLEEDARREMRLAQRAALFGTPATGAATWYAERGMAPPGPRTLALLDFLRNPEKEGGLVGAPAMALGKAIGQGISGAAGAADAAATVGAKAIAGLIQTKGFSQFGSFSAAAAEAMGGGPLEREMARVNENLTGPAVSGILKQIAAGVDKFKAVWK